MQKFYLRWVLLIPNQEVKVEVKNIKEVKMEVKVEVKMEVKMDNTFVCNKAFVLFRRKSTGLP